MGITVTFAGLMLICLAGDRDCPTSKNGNTAWVVKGFDKGNAADRSPCGWDSLGENETHLVVSFEIGAREVFSHPYCHEVPQGSRYYECRFPETNLCIVPYPDRETKNYVSEEVEFLPRLNEIDDKFVKIREERLGGPYAPSRIHFPFGKISASPVWRTKRESDKNNGYPTKWYRATGSMQTKDFKHLSDKLTAEYPSARYVLIGECGKKGKLRLGHDVTIRNQAKYLVATAKGSSYDLTYLLWYYRLGYWDTLNNDCPSYSKDAVLLRCSEEWCYRPFDGKTTFWPVMRNARP